MISKKHKVERYSAADTVIKYDSDTVPRRISSLCCLFWLIPIWLL